MKISYEWVQNYFDDKLPSPEKISEALTFHAFELESMERSGNDAIFDVKVTPNRGHDALSHRGVAKEISAILGIPLKRDPLRENISLTPTSQELSIAVENPALCRRYSAAVIKNIAVKESPQWLKERLRAIGQKPINNIVDATNFVMFDLGQPLHAFDGDQLKAKGAKRKIFVRNAAEGETTETLDKQKKELSPSTLLIADGETGAPLGIAGVKGGRAAQISGETKNIIIESANFNGASIRKTAAALKLRTDASIRFEHELSPELTAYALNAALELILKLASGELEGYVDVYPKPQKARTISVSRSHINRSLGLSLAAEELEDIFERLGFPFKKKDDIYEVLPPFERLDIEIPEDLIEEVGRIHGYADLASVMPEPMRIAEYNKTFYYCDKVRETLAEFGFSEVFTSSFRERGSVAMQNAFASDKSYLREDLKTNMEKVLLRNIHNAPLLGSSAVRTFEIGAVFPKEGERLSLCVGVKYQNERGQKRADEDVSAAFRKISDVLGAKIAAKAQGGITEVLIGEILEKLPAPSSYEVRSETPKVRYVPFSPYPFIARDIALWIPEGKPEEPEKIIRENAGALLVRCELFDEFKKGERTSRAYRLVFQSHEKTLEDREVNAVMERLTDALRAEGFEVR